MSSLEYLRKYHQTERGRELRNKARKKNYAKSRELHSANRYTRWTSWEMDLVLEHSIPDIELSAKIGRSVQAIQGKRNKIKNKKENEDEV